MRAIVTAGPGSLQVVTRPQSTPAAGQVVVKVAYSGVNRHDCNQRRRGAPPPGATDILGLEVSGTITAVGADVARDLLGKPVAALVNGGGYAEYTLAEAALCFPIPADMPMDIAAALPEALFTAWLNLVVLCDLRAGDIVLVHGGTSGVGSIALQLVNLLGAHPYATAGSAEKRDACLKFGAKAAFDYRGDFATELREATGGKGADVILDMSGGAHVAQNLAALADDGRITHLSAGGEGDVALPLALLMRKRARMTGALLRALPLARKTAIAADLRKVWGNPAIAPRIHAIMSLEQATEAHRALESGHAIGKILLSPGLTAAADR